MLGGHSNNDIIGSITSGGAFIFGAVLNFINLQPIPAALIGYVQFISFIVGIIAGVITIIKHFKKDKNK